MRSIGIALVGFSAVGCVGQEGLRLESSEWGVEEIVEQRESREKSDDQGIGAVPTDLVIIGTVSAFRPLTEANIEEIYTKYIEFSKRVRPEDSFYYAQDDFVRDFAGWTRLKVFTVPLVMGSYEYALVPRELYPAIRFPSGFGTFMVQEAGDLLAARTNRDGYFIVRQVLCKDGDGYAKCAENYDKGFFDGSTGKELNDRNLEPKDSGKQINPLSYRKIDL